SVVFRQQFDWDLFDLAFLARFNLEWNHHAGPCRRHLWIFPRTENARFQTFAETRTDSIEAGGIQNEFGWIDLSFVLVWTVVQLRAVSGQARVEVRCDSRSQISACRRTAEQTCVRRLG